MSREPLLADLLRAAHRRGWPLARLDAAADPAAPFEGRDADLLAGWRPWADWLGLVRIVAAHRGWTVVNAVPMGGVMAVWAVDPAADPADPSGSAQIDFHRALSACGVPFVDVQALFAGATVEGDVLRLRPADARAVRGLEKWLVHGDAPPVEVPPALARAALGHDDCLDRAWHGARTRRLSALTVALRRRPAAVLRLALAKVLDWGRRLARPPGILLAVSGPDGAGKSSLIAALTTLLPRRVAPGVRLFHTRPFLLPRLGISPPPPTVAESTAPPPGPVRSWLRWAVACADYWLGGLLWVRPALVAGRVVVFDRYVSDYRAAPERRGLSVPAWALNLMTRFAPRSAIAVVLTAPPDLLIRRKGEATPEEAARQNRTYARLAAEKPVGLVLDTGALDPAAVVRQVHAHLIEVMAAHARSDRP
ncbi:hypothetical protein [Azospirillum sp. TSH100]|uniref:hypothetical protein n=1 Tax=Azospirillum sp. TSH100 TaxID=652764 RepID=UPI0010A9EB96|nr:hypothetical protein [Azospirillum sp. TSH100]QCG91052.1 hypothetical protein E6C72_25195 [Azospirillum sp. TSH100]